MGALDGFMSTWSSARDTLGQGAPQDGTAFDRSSDLRQAQSSVDGAAPRSRWTGSAADAYGAANTKQSQILGQMAALDQRLGAEVDRSAAVITAGRQNLDSVKQWVTAAAASVPEGADREQMLNQISRKGLGDLSDVVRQTNTDLNSIGGRIQTIGNEYRKLGENGQAPSPAPDILTAGGKDKTVPGKPVRPLDGVLTDEEWRIARLSPTLLDEYEQATAAGWTFTSNPGEGTYTNARDKVINIDPELANNGPFQRVNALSHELGHALKNPPLDRSSKEAYVNSQLDGEGAATMNTIKIEREILAAGGPEIIPPQANDDNFKLIYDAYVQNGSTHEAYQDAIRQIGQVYGDLVPSTDPSTTYREYYGRGYK